MANVKDLKPAQIIGPGDIIKDYLKARGWTQEDLADVTEITVKTINQIINHKQGITVDTAKLFSRAFETSPEFWLNLDNHYRLKMVAAEPREDAAEIKAKIRTYMPVLEIQKNGWVDVFDNSAEGYKATYREIWDRDYTDSSVYEETFPYVARSSKEDKDFTRYYGITWHRIALNRARREKVAAYNKEMLETIREHFGGYTLSGEGVEEILKDLRSSGVKFLFQKHLSKTYLDGACFYDGSNPVIVYTARYDRRDHFWFTLAHEIAHILIHFKDEVGWVVQDNHLEEAHTEKWEIEADSLAREMIHSEEILRLGQPFQRYFSEKNLLAISEEVGIAPDVVLGILQHEKMVDYRSRLNKFKMKIRPLLLSL